MKRVAPLMLLGALTMFDSSALSAPMMAYDQVMQAVYARDETALKYLISIGLNINAVNQQGKTALCTTVENQDYEGYELLLSQGATTRTLCMRYMDPEIMNRFVAEQPALGTYYKGAVLTASRNGAVTGVGKDIAATVGSLPYPHLGEFVLAGIAVGTALAIGAHGSGGGDQPTIDNYSSPFNNSDPTASNYLNATYFSAPTKETLSKTQKGGITGITDEVVKRYASEYAGGNWKAGSIEIDNINFLDVIHAADAYARGYSGTIVSRDEKGEPTAKGWQAVSDNKVKVAVMDTGLFYHTDLSSCLFKDWIPGSSTDTYKQSIGLNYEYGVESSANKGSYYWAYGTWDVKGKQVTGSALFYQDEPAWGTVFVQEKSSWYKYAGKFAPVCGSGEDKDGNCLKMADDSEDSCQVQYVSNYGKTSETVLATYYTYANLWNEYKAKYGKTGYVYDATNATPNFFDNKENISFDHGTHVAGIIGALRNGTGMQGVAYNSEILPVKIDLYRSYGLLSDVADVARQAKIINLSIGPSNMTTDSFVSNDLSTTQTNWDKLLDYHDTPGNYDKTADYGAIQVIAAGNSKQAQPSIYTAAPLVNDNFKNLVISVVALGDPGAASYHDKTGDIASYSNRCGATAKYCLAAPGGDANESEQNPIVSTSIDPENLTNAYQPYVGTSQAAPVVSGSLAVLMGAFPFLTSQQAVQILLKTADYIKPDKDEIDAYNRLAGSSDAYTRNTVEDENNKYNAIYGRGIVDLAAATDPVGLPKITFDTTASSDKAELVGNSVAHVSSTLENVVQALPKNIIALDDYTRAYPISVKHLVQKEVRTDSFRRSFRSFMAQNEKKVQASEKISFAFSQTTADKKHLPKGSMSMMMKPAKGVQMRLGFTEDTASFGGSYVGRNLQNPFMNMRQAFGGEAQIGFAKNWMLTGAWYTGKNGFIDEDVFDKLSKKPRMRLMESGVAYQGIPNLTLGISGGVMAEEESLLGTRGTGAFKTSGAETRFVRIMANYAFNNKFRIGGAYTYGMTEAQKGVSLMNISRLTTDSFAVTAEYQPDEKQTFGMKFVSPLRVRSGVALFDLPVGRDMYEDKIYRENYVAGLKPQAREYDLSVFYANDISSDLSWAGETGVRLNPDHQKNVSPDYRALFKLNWTW